MSKRRLSIALAVVALVAGAFALAQATTDSDAVQQTLSELRQRAQRLTLLAQVPAEGRAQAEELLDRAEALRTAAQELEVQRLQAYIAALENGDSPSVATQVAEQQTSEASVALTRQREELSADVEAFLKTYPDVGTTLRARLGLGQGSGFLGMGRMGGSAGSGMMLDTPFHGGHGMQRGAPGTRTR